MSVRALIIAVCACAGVAAAQPAPEGAAKDPAAAKKSLQTAQALVQKGDALAKANKASEAKESYTNAITAYQNAIDNSDDVSLYYSLALVEEKAGNAVAAYKHLRRVVDGYCATLRVAARPGEAGACDPKAGLKPDVVKKAQAKLDDLAARVALVSFAITPDHTTIQLAGATVGESPMAEPLVLDPGTYDFSFVAVGFDPKQKTIKVDAGSESQHTIKLEPVKVEQKPADRIVDTTPGTTPPPSRMPLYIGAGATGGFLLIGTITGIAALVEHGRFTDPKTGLQARHDAQNNGRTLARLTDVCLVGAIGAAVFTAYWYRYKYQPQMSSADQNHAKLDIVPWVQPQAGGVFAVGTF